MTTEKLPNQVLPHNPLKAVGVLDEVNRLKGNRTWIQFELELLVDKYPDNAVLKGALGEVTGKVKTSSHKPQSQKANQKTVNSD